MGAGQSGSGNAANPYREVGRLHHGVGGAGDADMNAAIWRTAAWSERSRRSFIAHLTSSSPGERLRNDRGSEQRRLSMWVVVQPDNQVEVLHG
jgi:hypothetical protein